ncbi:hypothetical protein FDP41_008967 [Naegleria fowleri]|uniref:Uncharacterized protein n=1 Tax=Naegleria fowleri TaxID=5763 RepID=A0A6A5BFG9_NAEFO|nr:uncharacterized protein FDP41_008967 [Naegleria fowleri]KAF0972718.1 hypothetical protein FDP41_008967 [Naegleria fowleri]
MMITTTTTTTPSSTTTPKTPSSTTSEEDQHHHHHSSSSSLNHALPSFLLSGAESSDATNTTNSTLSTTSGSQLPKPNNNNNSHLLFNSVEPSPTLSPRIPQQQQGGASSSTSTALYTTIHPQLTAGSAGGGASSASSSSSSLSNYQGQLDSPSSSPHLLFAQSSLLNHEELENLLRPSSFGRRVGGDLNELFSKSAPSLNPTSTSDSSFFQLESNTSMLLSIGSKVSEVTSGQSVSKKSPKSPKSPSKHQNIDYVIQPLHSKTVMNNHSSNTTPKHSPFVSSQSSFKTPEVYPPNISMSGGIETTSSPHLSRATITSSSGEEDHLIEELFHHNGLNSNQVLVTMTGSGGGRLRSKSSLTPYSPSLTMEGNSLNLMTPTKLAFLRNATNGSMKGTSPLQQNSQQYMESPGGVSVETVISGKTVDSPNNASSSSLKGSNQLRDSLTQSLKRKYSRAGSKLKLSRSALDERRLSLSLEALGSVLEHNGVLITEASMRGSELLQAVLHIQSMKEIDVPKSTQPTQEKESDLELERKKNVLREILKQCDKMQCNSKLYTACKENDVLTATLILEEFISNCDLNFRNGQDMDKSFLHICAKDNHTEILELLLECGADPNVKDKISRTPLHVACAAGSHFAMVLLLGHEAMPNVRDEYGFSPLSLALKQHYFDMAKDLLLFGADVNLKQFDGSTLLHDFFGNGDLDVVKFLVSDLPDSHTLLTMVRNEHGWSALFCAIQNSQIDVIRYLLNSKYQAQIFSSLSNSSNSGENVFHIVARSGDVDMLSELINIFNERESQEHKMLLQQTMSNVPNYMKNIAVMVRELLKLTTTSSSSGELVDKKKKLYRAVEVNVMDKKGNTPLHYCLFDMKEKMDFTSSAILTFLISCKNCKVDVKNEKGVTVKSLAKQYGVMLKE